MWMYDSTNYLMVELETIIALATITYIIEKQIYKLQWMNKCSMILSMIDKDVLLRVF